MNNGVAEFFTWFLAAIVLFLVFFAVYFLFIRTGPAGIPIGVQWFTEVLTR